MNKTAKKMYLYIMENYRPKSQRERGVKDYAIDLLDELSENHGGNKQRTNSKSLYLSLLNGARNRKEYSRGGMSLIRDEDIAKRLSAPRELRKTNNGQKKPNKNEERLDTQTRALRQAEQLITRAYRGYEL